MASRMAAKTGLGWLPDYVRGYALLASGNAKDAESLARRLEDIGVHDVRIRHLLINTLLAQGKSRQSIYWIRRNMGAVDDPVIRAEYGRAVAMYQRMHPDGGISMAGGVIPSTNVTKGTAMDTVYLNDLPFAIAPEAQQGAGITATASATAFRRFQTGELNELMASVTAGVERGIYGTETDLLTLSPRLRFVVYRGANNFWVGPVSELQWQGGRPYARRWGMAAGTSLFLSPSDRLDVTTEAVKQDSRDRPYLDGTRIKADMAWKRKLPGSSVLTLGAGFTRETTRAGHLSFRGGRASATLGRTWQSGLYADFSFSWEEKFYDADFPLISEPRKDREASLQIGFAHERLKLFGTIPYVGARYVKHGSNVPLYRFSSTDLVLRAHRQF